MGHFAPIAPGGNSPVGGSLREAVRRWQGRSLNSLHLVVNDRPIRHAFTACRDWCDRLAAWLSL